MKQPVCKRNTVHLFEVVTTAMLYVFQRANVLQAVLCLINELDRDALEIVDDAIRNRLHIP